MTAAGNLRAAGLAIILAWGWKRAAIALVAGALSALAMAPINAWPVLFATFPVAVWLIDGAGAGRLRGVPAAAMAGWWFGLGYFVPGLRGAVDQHGRAGEDRHGKECLTPKADQRRRLRQRQRLGQGVTERIPWKAGECMAAQPFAHRQTCGKRDHPRGVPGPDQPREREA